MGDSYDPLAEDTLQGFIDMFTDAMFLSPDQGTSSGFFNFIFTIKVTEVFYHGTLINFKIPCLSLRKFFQKVAELMSSHVPVYNYRFSFKGKYIM